MDTTGDNSQAILRSIRNNRIFRGSSVAELDAYRVRRGLQRNQPGAHLLGAGTDCAPPGVLPSQIAQFSQRFMMHDNQRASGPQNIRHNVFSAQRRTVSPLHENAAMPRPRNMPADLDTPGKRIAWWRRYRKKTLKQVAAKAKCSPGALSDFENGRYDRFGQLHLVCGYLKLNAFYVDSGRGEPELDFEQEPPTDGSEWPLPGVDSERVSNLDPLDKQLASYKINEILDEIELERRKQRKAQASVSSAEPDLRINAK